jgi:hypothetical protein
MQRQSGAGKSSDRVFGELFSKNPRIGFSAEENQTRRIGRPKLKQAFQLGRSSEQERLVQARTVIGVTITQAFD